MVRRNAELAQRKGAAKHLPPDPQAAATFERSKLDWSELDRSAHADLFEWHRRLIALRAARAVGGAKPKVKFDEEARWLRFEHAGLMAALNFADAPRRVPLPSGAWERVLASTPQEPDPVSAGGASV